MNKNTLILQLYKKENVLVSTFFFYYYFILLISSTQLSLSLFLIPCHPFFLKLHSVRPLPNQATETTPVKASMTSNCSQLSLCLTDQQKWIPLPCVFVCALLFKILTCKMPHSPNFPPISWASSSTTLLLVSLFLPNFLTSAWAKDQSLEDFSSQATLTP